MINVAQSKAALAALEGEVITMPRAQVAELLDEAESGQAAKRALRNIKMRVELGVNVAGSPA